MQFIRKVTFPRATRLISTAVSKSKETDERRTDSTFSQTSTWERLFFYPNPLLPSRKIEESTGIARQRRKNPRDME